MAPSFFDAPGAQGSSNTALPSAPAPQFSGDQLPNITFAFASEVGYKVSLACIMYTAPESCPPRQAPGMHQECIGDCIGDAHGMHGDAHGMHGIALGMHDRCF